MGTLYPPPSKQPVGVWERRGRGGLGEEGGGCVWGGRIGACLFEQTPNPVIENIIVTFVLVVLIVLVLFVVASKDKENSKLRKWLD